MKLTPTQTRMLHCLEACGGEIKAEQLPKGWASLGTKMASKGLTKWHAPGYSRRWTCKGQILSITDAGRAALRPY